MAILKCTVSEDRDHIRPCDALAKETEFGNPHPRKRGIFCWALRNMKTGKASRTMFGVVSTESPKGFLFNFCPFCGESIDAPFTEPEEPTP
jgi:hypothetical protein